jgi:hypothetical protein
MDNKALEVIKESGVEQQTAKMLQESFSPFFDEAGKVIEESKLIVVTDVSQKYDMAKAREMRLILKNARVSADKKRKELKEDSLRYGKAVQGIYNVLDFLIVPAEKYLEDQEKFEERIEEKKKQDLIESRNMQIVPVQEYVPSGIDLGSITEDDFQKLLAGAKFQMDAKKEAEAKAEQERIEAAKAADIEQARIKEENERLKKEAEALEKAQAKEREENEKALKAEREAREKAEAEKKAIEEKQRKEKENADRKALEEKRIADKKIADEKAAELKRIAEEKELERKAANAPDKEKIIAFVTSLSLISYPEVNTEDAKRILQEAKLSISKIAGILTTKANEL